MDNHSLPDQNHPTGVDETATTAAIDMNGTSFVPSVPDLIAPNGYSQIPDPTFTNLPLPMHAVQPAVFAMAPQQTTQAISADEIALYDRQIRLLGMQVQEKLRRANVLLIGMKGLGAEIAKNLVLAGIGTLTILDHEVVTEEDLGTQFFLNEAQIGQNRAEAALPELQKLNPRVELYPDPHPVVMKDPEYFQTFDVTIATGLMFEIMATINMSCRMLGRKFYAADTHGMYGYIFADLLVHEFLVERGGGNRASKVGDMETSTRRVTGVNSRKDGDKVIDLVTYEETYSPLQLVNLSPLPSKARATRRSRMRITPLLSCLRALFDFQTQSEGRLPGPNRADLEVFTRLANQKHLELQLPMETLKADFLRSFLQNLGSEISPVVAFLGGYLAQDVINVLGEKEVPLQNFLLFDGEEFTATPFSIHPINDDAVTLMNERRASAVPESVPMDGSVMVA